MSKINKAEIRIGSDIEIFLRSKSTGKFVSGIGLIGGSKDAPRPLEKEGCCIQEDNVALEYNVPPVTLSEAGLMWENINYVLETVRKVTNVTEDMEFVCCSSAVFEEDQLQNEKAQEFGCEPDYDAWLEGVANDKPTSENKGLRSCGGHIHVSYPGANQGTSITLIKIFDLFLGVPSVLIDTDVERRKLYGKAGAFRFKEWPGASGFEYRTLSNFWTESKEKVEWVFSQIDKAIDFYNNEIMGVEIYAEEIQTAINESNKALAEQICKEFGIEAPTLDKVTA